MSLLQWTNRVTMVLSTIALLGCAALTKPPTPTAQATPETQEAAPQEATCPDGVPAGARCLRGIDSANAPYLMVVPAQWNRTLVVHAHGGPALGPPDAKRADEDIKRWAIVVRAGYAWAGSVFRQGGVAVRSAAEDTERVRRIFVQHVAQPARTLLHGQSWGASVAAKTAEMYAGPGMRSPYDGVLLSSGVLAGGARAYDFRLDLRVIYQYLCGNHPRADEAQYPLWMGLPKDSTLSRADLRARVNQCLGLAQKAAQRTPEQSQKLKTIVDVLRIPESSVLAHLNWATWHFQDIAYNRTNGKNPFRNDQVRYQGSADDAALNAAVLRYSADPQALASFAADTDLTGRIAIPVLTVHGIGDATAFVEMEAAFRDTMARAGNAERLVQVFSDHADHSYLSDPTYVTLLDALVRWSAQGEKPRPADLAQRCRTFEERYGSGCRLLPDYVPAPLATRMAPR